ncbi:MAG TPA: zf-HC2 domain-containing protein [Gemmatimonadaceae bacterium]|nr:zf-HC2 domain-containing protein [Gemmatimonadaceae bacterium]
MVSRAECEFVVMRLWPYLDGVLSEEERERIVRHLEVCRDCHSHFDFANAFLDAVAAARPHLKVNDSLRSRVMGALTAEGFRAAGN